MKSSFRLLAVALLITGMGCGTINQPIHIADGSQVSRTLSSINGSVSIGKACEIDGSCHTINGSITIDDKTRIDGKVATINGSIRIGRDVNINGPVKAVNGSVSAEGGTVIDGTAATVNGCINLVATRVERDLVTYNGKITLKKGSEVMGDIVIKEAEGTFRRTPLHITIGGMSTVHGSIINDNPKLNVTVEILEGSAVKGEILRCEVERP